MFFKRIYKRVKTGYNRIIFEKNAMLGKHFQVGTLSLCDNRTGKKQNIQIGNNCFILGSLIVQGDGKLEIGDNCYVGVQTMIGALSHVVIQDNVIISSYVRIMDNNNHPTNPQMRRAMTESHEFTGKLWQWNRAENAPVIIEDNVWIGEFAYIAKGVHIGKGSVIGAHTVVTKDIPDNVVAVGNPARVVKCL